MTDTIKACSAERHAGEIIYECAHYSSTSTDFAVFALTEVDVAKFTRENAQVEGRLLARLAEESMI